MSAFSCELCDLADLQSQLALEEHLKGRKHLKKAQRHAKACRPLHNVIESAIEREGAASSAERFFEALASGKFCNVIVFTGAGISTSCGIPDFRTPQTGLFDRTKEHFRKLKDSTRMGGEPQSEHGKELARLFTDEAKYLQTPETFFSRQFVTQYPTVWRTELEPGIREAMNVSPSAAHHFCGWLHRQGWLRRVYTQNIDGLHTADVPKALLQGDFCPQAGMPSSSDKTSTTAPLLPDDLVVECHGSIRKGNLVMYGDSLPVHVDSCLRSDFPKNGSDQDAVDLVMVLGTSLQVAPFCAFPNLARRTATRVLVNLPLADCLVNPWGDARQAGTPRAGKLDVEYYHGMYGSGGLATSMKVAGREVSLCPKWTDARRFPRQLLCEQACDSFVRAFFARLARGRQGQTAGGEVVAHGASTRPKPTESERGG